MSAATSMDPARLVAGKPDGLTRSLERLLPLLGFTQVVNIDGPNDQGGDLLAYYRRELVAVQVKWRADPVHGAVSDDAVDEVSNAIDAYEAATTVAKPATSSANLTGSHRSYWGRTRRAPLRLARASIPSPPTWKSGKVWNQTSLASEPKTSLEARAEVRIAPFDNATHL